MEIPAPPNLAYRNFQKEGIEFALRVLQNNRACLLADDQGVGKTIEGLGLVNALAAQGKCTRTVVVTPARVVRSWEAEACKWLVQPTTIEVPSSADDCFPQGPRFTIVNVEKLVGSRAKGLREQLIKEPIDLLIVDEIHRYANSKKSYFASVFSSKKQDVRGLCAVSSNVLALSGTPAPNGPRDMASWAAYLWPRIFESEFKFKVRYCDGRRVTIPTRGDPERKIWMFTGRSHMDELREKLRPVMLRRRKDQVLTELPEKQRQLVEIDLDAPLLNKVAWKSDNDLVRDLSAFKDNLSSAPEELLKKTSAGMTKELREVGLAKAKAVAEAIDDAASDPWRKIIVFTWHHAVTDEIARETNARCVVLDGRTSASEAKKIIDRFQAVESKDQVLVASLKAAGVGITLTAASLVLIAQPSWTPADMLQAEDRAYRMGQKNKVLIRYFVGRKSVECAVVRAAIEKLEAGEVIVGDKDTRLGYAPFQRKLAADLARTLRLSVDTRRSYGLNVQMTSFERILIASCAQAEFLTQKQTAVIWRLIERNAGSVPPDLVQALRLTDGSKG